MGIPKFARFLINRYPLILKKIKEEVDVPEIDINGVIHKKAHNNSAITMCKERTFDEIFYDIFLYIDEIVHLIKPRKLLMISADGVAPRAKMNQQRSRRYRKTNINKKELDTLRKQGLDPDRMFNSDCISAGTEFMFELSKAFDIFVMQKLKSDPLWKDLKIVLTGVDVPGEGEHKIIEYIRKYKNSSEYDACYKHCIYGLDADLIMLSLITHEPNICILREEVFSSKKKASESSVRGEIKIQEPFEFIFISILREYLELEFLEIRPRLKFNFNIERIIDDFIFFCFFIGNDFLPNLNTLDINDGALDNIFLYYKNVLPNLDDYISYHGKIDFKKAEQIFTCLATHELKNIEKMLGKVEVECAQRDKKQKKIISDRKKLQRIKKLTAKKENFLINLKEKDEGYIINFKKERIEKKLKNFRDKYEKEANLRGKKIQFEEDLKKYLDDELKKQIKKIHEKDKKDLEDTYTDFIRSESAQSESDSSININNKISEKVKSDSINDKKGFIALFDSDDENAKKSKDFQKDKLNQILSNAGKYNRYVQDINYCSDININDIDDQDVGEISDIEVNVNEVSDYIQEEYGEDQDMDKIFHQKLLKLYITDVNQAKAFYYKEKLNIDLNTPEGHEEHKNMFRKYLEGLQWVLFYYYRGVQSWKWYYPYHYAPMISDFNNVKKYIDYDMEKSFNYDKPFSPFQSLMFILPKTSRNLFPQCYWSIYDKYQSIFPINFKIDFNGKKMPWESLVLLPFLQEEIIIEYETEIREKYHPCAKHLLNENEWPIVLSDKDLERNMHGHSYIYFNDKSSNTTARFSFEIYSDSTLTNIDSNYAQKVVDYKFPTLKTVFYDYSSDFKKQYFGKQEKKIKVISIKPILNQSQIGLEKLKSYLYNGIVYVNYPFKQEACIRGILNNNQYCYLNNFNNFEIDGKAKVCQEIRETIRREWYKKGVKIDSSTILVEVSLLKGIARNTDGTISKIYDDSFSFYVPFEITSLNSHLNDFINLNKDFLNLKTKYSSIETEFSSENPSLILSKISFGKLATTTKIITKNNNKNYNIFNEENFSKYYDENYNFDLEGLDWQVALEKIYDGPLVEVEIKNSYQNSLFSELHVVRKMIKDSDEEYISMDELAKQIGISTWALGLITSTIFVVNCTNDDEILENAKLSELEHWNIGLNIKSRNKGQKLILPGYTRYTESSHSYVDSLCWEFSKNAVDLIKDYKRKYPFVFECLEKYKKLYGKSERFFRIYELFSTLENFTEKMTEIVIWINSLNTSQISFAGYQSAFLSVNDCRKIQELVTEKNKLLKENQMNSNFSQLLVLNPNYLFQESYPYIPPFMAYQPPPFQLGDRVVNIRSTDYSFIPFGEKGTVTAVSNDFIEVLFDNEFFGGSTCKGRFKANCGAYVKPVNLINLTK